MDDRILVLMVVGPGPLRDGLRALLMAIPQVESLKEVNDASSALSATRGFPPSLVLVNADPPADQIWDLLEQIKAEWPQTRSILMVDDTQQQQLAQAAGADCVLLKGVPASKLCTTIKSLLPGTAS